MKIFINILKITGIVLTVILFIILMIILPQQLLKDKSSKAEIDEGKYILNLLADEYEKLLSQRRELLQKETERLLSEKGITRTLEEKRIIELRLKELEIQRKNLNKEFEDNLLKKKEIENIVENLQLDIESSGSQLIQMNEKYLELANEKEKQGLYWEKYKNDIKEYILSNYTDNPKKTNEIESGFAKDNGREYIFSEISNLNNSISKLQNQIQVQKENFDNLKTFDSSMVDENKELKMKLEDYENKLATLENTSEILNKYEKINYHFTLAKRYFDNKNYTNATIEYKNTLNTIDQVKNSYENIQKIQKDRDNEKAGDLYDKALKNINNKRFNFALNQLESIIRETPNSDYTNNALRSILGITNQLTDKDKISSQNEGARELMTTADSKVRNNNLNDALEQYYNVILNYPYSNYTEQAIKNIMNLNRALLKRRMENFGQDLKNNFKENYDVYVGYYKKGYYEKARNFYYEILNNVFGEYSNNSILPFKEFEDKYIEMLIENSKELWR